MKAPPSNLKPASRDPALRATPDDHILVARARLGDRAAFDQLVIRYRTGLISWLMRYTHNHADAEDATQDAFINAYRALSRFRGESTFLTWLCRIALNAVRTRLRRRARDRTMFVSAITDEGDGDLSPALAEQETPENLALTDDIRTLVSDTLQLLPDAQRVAISLREISGLSYQEIAAHMSTPIGTVRSRVSRARDILDLRIRAASRDGIGLPGRGRSQQWVVP